MQLGQLADAVKIQSTRYWIIKNTKYQIQIHKYISFFVAAGSPGNAVARVQPGGGGEAAEDDGGQPSYSQVFDHDDDADGDDDDDIYIMMQCVCVFVCL